MAQHSAAEISAPRRRVTLRALVILRTLLAEPASAPELIAAAEAELGAEAFGRGPLYALRRDLQALRAAGFAVRHDRLTGRYSLAGQPSLAGLAPDHVRALGILLRSVHDDLPYGEALRECLAVVVSALPPALQSHVRGPGLRIDLGAEPALGAHQPTIALIEHALATRRCLQFTYRAASRGVESRRTVEPLDLVFRDHHVYFEAFDLTGGHHRQFRVDRMAEAVVLPRLSQRQPAGRPGFRLRFRVSPRLARHGPSGFRHMQITPLSDGSAIVTAEASSLFWAARRLLAYGEHVEVLYPPGLRREMFRVATALAAHHQQSTLRVAEERALYDPGRAPDAGAPHAPSP